MKNAVRRRVDHTSESANRSYSVADKSIHSCNLYSLVLIRLFSRRIDTVEVWGSSPEHLLPLTQVGVKVFVAFRATSSGELTLLRDSYCVPMG
jgi:hypothetical protein